MDGQGDRLRQARIRAKYEHATDAARDMGVPEQTYLAHENGNRGLQKNLSKYARFFKVSAIWLLNGEGSMELGASPDPTADLSPEKRAEALRFIEFLRSSENR